MSNPDESEDPNLGWITLGPASEAPEPTFEELGQYADIAEKIRNGEIQIGPITTYCVPIDTPPNT